MNAIKEKIDFIWFVMSTNPLDIKYYKQAIFVFRNGLAQKCLDSNVTHRYCMYDTVQTATDPANTIEQVLSRRH